MKTTQHKTPSKTFEVAVCMLKFCIEFQLYRVSRLSQWRRGGTTALQPHLIIHSIPITLLSSKLTYVYRNGIDLPRPPLHSQLLRTSLHLLHHRRRLPHQVSAHPDLRHRRQSAELGYSGPGTFSSISGLYYLGANACLLCYDITDETSSQEMMGWLGELKQNLGE